MSEARERPVVICTKYRGVFFGYTTDTSGDTIALARARMCVYWDQSMLGVLGLASQGPSDKCRISQATPSVEARGVTAVMEMTPKAIERWEKGLWA